ncbi:DUF2075 domain-containing protein [Psychroserpens ponticola]|uniref:DUF2075 domain-containing protein n=1 Tax=Psychroserpens ponticola TaxID=2932268 RepID=A0ABY7RZ66_9FLAO|nr:DUF2075 domain-containing protein [Psychroserpens ponticola]WCO02000.1 DUF2075 domain-containing protein [Psychroserpens ponticola]
MNRAYYSNSISSFITEDSNSIYGQLSSNHKGHSLEELQKKAWLKQIEILKEQLGNFNGSVYFEFAIPRMGKRVDNIVIIEDCIFVIEFKVGTNIYTKHAQMQAIDYALDLRNFHEGSHHAKLVPVLVATNAKKTIFEIDEVLDFNEVVKCNKNGIEEVIKGFVNSSNYKINIKYWEDSAYKPTPTIVEAAQALYKGHDVKEISRYDSGAINLSKTTTCLNKVIEYSKLNKKKSICFVTGVPGAGKTLAGLNIANERMKVDENEYAVFLSGNGPLVDVLREALSRDSVKDYNERGEKIKIADARSEANTFIQNIHHFRNEYITDTKPPNEKVVVFDEAQRAWDKDKLTSWMNEEGFSMSEPEFLIDVMNRHSDWCTIVCLIGGGQEINRGEAGIEEWINTFKENYQEWNIHYSDLITESQNYIRTNCQKLWLIENAVSEKELHLSVSVRSFRSEKISEFVHEFLEINNERAKELFKLVKDDFPIFFTRNLTIAKKWLREQAKGTERIGVVASSGARRLKSIGIDVKNEIEAPKWFLNINEDVRSSNFLEETATEFDIQGLEIDYTCLAWGANFHIVDGHWKFQSFRGTKWNNIHIEKSKEYLKNTYRVLLTRARQGLIIYLPEGSDIDHTRPSHFYDGTYNYFKEIGIEELF